MVPIPKFDDFAQFNEALTSTIWHSCIGSATGGDVVRLRYSAEGRPGRVLLVGSCHGLFSRGFWQPIFSFRLHANPSLCGSDVTSVQVSRVVLALDEELTKWRNRALGEILYLLLDARYEKVRVSGAVVSCAL